LKKFVKRLAESGICLATIIIMAEVSAIASGSFSYSAEKGIVSIEYNDVSQAEKHANVSLLPIGTDRVKLDIASVDSNKMMFDVIGQSNSVFKREYSLKKKIEPGEYVLYLDFDNKSESYVLINCDNAKLNNLLSRLNSGENIGAAVDFGADNDIYGAYGQIIENLVKNQKSGSFTADSFLKAYLCAEGIARVRGGQISAAEFADLYGEWFDADLSEIKSSDESEKTEFGRIIKSAPIDARTAEEIVNDAAVLAKISGAESTGDAEKILLSYIDENKLPYANFKKLNDYYRSETITAVFAEIKSVRTMSELYDKFISIANSMYNKQSNLSGGSSGGSGGGSGGGKKIEAVTNITEGKEPFSDISGHWSKDYIISLSKKGYISGYPDKTFRPDNSVTRAEMVKLVCNMLKLKEKESTVFDDVRTGDWFCGCVGAASETGIVNGDGKSFFPNATVTRQDAAVIIMRMLKYCGKELSGSKSFSDSGMISDYAQSGVSSLAANGIINGENGCFNPTRPVTRGELAALIERAAAYIQ